MNNEKAKGVKITATPKGVVVQVEYLDTSEVVAQFDVVAIMLDDVILQQIVKRKLMNLLEEVELARTDGSSAKAH